MKNTVSIKTYRNPGLAVQTELSIRPAMDTSALKDVIEGVYHKIEQEGDLGLKELTSQFDGVSIEELKVTKKEIIEASALVSKELKESINRAYQNIHKFHLTQELVTKKVETSTGVTCWQESRSIDKVGLYIPGGSAPLFSTVLMLGIPAQIAGCEQVVMCTPPNKEGVINPAILYTAGLCGITEVYKIGGSQAIAAMVVGTESVPSVFKIFGPGNQYVTAAKMKALDYGIAIDLPAGPSEVLVFADDTANPAFVAADLLSQAEHGKDSQVVLVTTSERLLNSVEQSLNEQLQELPRKEIAEAALSHAYSVFFDNVEHAFDFINLYAPEHFIIGSDNATDYISHIRNAGSVFLGNMTPESAGDYASGTNHTLPTSAYARSYSGVSLDSFIKKITFQEINTDGITDLGPSIINMAEMEELQGHANAVKVRLNSLQS